jgi:hypothetical protein
MAALWFYDLGLQVFPTINKVPAIPRGTSWKDYRAPRKQVSRWRESGVPLGLAVVVDSDTAAAEAILAEHLPDTPFKVTTGPYHDGSPGRGRHRYFWLAGDAPHFITRNGLTIEFKHRGQYVVGPGSVRPDGVHYEADSWSWDMRDVPVFPVEDFCFDDGSSPHATVGQASASLVLPDVIVEPFRRATLHKLMRSLVANGVPLGAAKDVCFAINRARCRPPVDVDATGLDAFLERAYRQKDRDKFVRAPKVGWELAGSLCAIGLPVDLVVAAVRSVTPDFDPEAENA